MLAFALWSVGALIAAGYCIVRGIGDLRRKNFIAGVIGLGSAAIFLLTPRSDARREHRRAGGDWAVTHHSS